MDKVFIVLYTHQKQKKAKTWHDGLLKASSHCKKATLYDDKGSRLDSIYITAGDITLGEQLESDRYYILVEEVKNAPHEKETLIQQKVDDSPACIPENTRQQISSSSAGRGSILSSQGRCSGLKRKNSGFVPPKMVKASRQESYEESSQRLYNNSCQIQQPSSRDFQLNQKLNSRMYNKDMENDCGGSDISMRLNQRNKINSSNLDNTSVSGLNNSNHCGSLPVLNSLASPIASYMNQLQKVCLDSQESNGSDSRLKSPWSVYGSNNNSPKTYSSPKLEESRQVIDDFGQVVLNQSSRLDNTIQSPDQGQSSSDLKNSEKSQNVILLDVQMALSDNCNQGLPVMQKTNIKPCNKNKEFSDQCKAAAKLLTVAYNNDNQDQNSLHSKRSMTQIMNLLKNKTACSDETKCDISTTSTTPSVETKLGKLYAEGNSRLEDVPSFSNEMNKRHQSAIIDKDIKKLNTNISAPTVLDVEPVLDKANQEETIYTSLTSSKLSKSDIDCDIDADPSFSISFSPLSDVACSDDDAEQETKSNENAAFGHSPHKNLEKFEKRETSIKPVELKLDCEIQRQNSADQHHVNDNTLHESLENTVTNLTGAFEQNICTDSMFRGKKDAQTSQEKETRVETKIKGIANNELQKDIDIKNGENNGNQSGKEVIQTHRNNVNCGDKLDSDTLANTSYSGREDAIEETYTSEQMHSSDTEVTKTVKNNSVNCKNESAANNIETDVNKANKETDDFIDLIDNSDSESKIQADPVGTETVCLGTVTPDKAPNDNNERKTTQSQDTMDYSCDTLSHCSNSQQNSNSQVPQMAMFQNVGKPKFNSFSQQISPQIPVVSESLCDRQGKTLYNNISFNKDQICNSEAIDFSQQEFLDSSKESHIQTNKNDFGPVKEKNNESQAQLQSKENVISKAESNSILTQIDLLHNTNLDQKCRKADIQQQLIWNSIADKITAWQASRVNAIPVSQLPHPSELFGRNVKKKVRKSDMGDTADLDMWGRQSSLSCVDDKRVELSKKINEKLKGYKISGSMCSGASRDKVHQRPKETTRTHLSPYQKLSDYDADISTDASPSLFDDCDEEKYQMKESFLEQQTDPPDLVVPDVCHKNLLSQSGPSLSFNPIVNKPATKQCVFISDSDTSKDCSPEHLVATQSHLHGEETDEDYIYTQIYKPRHMVPELCNTVIADKVDSQNTDSPVRGISPLNNEETLLNDESSEEFFTQPRSMVTKRNCVSGGLQLFREKQRAALRSKPFEDNVTHTSYQTYSVSPRRIANLQSGEKRETDDDRNKALNDTETYFVSDLGTGSKDNYHIDDQDILRYSSDETVLNSKKFDSTIRNSRVMPAFDNNDILINKSGHLDHTGAVCDRAEKELSDTNLSSQECAEIMSKSLKPADLKFPNTTQTEIAGLSKWEKYNSQHSEEEIDLDMTGFRAKVKDFTVIEKPSEAKQLDRTNTARCNTTQHYQEVNKNSNSVSNSVSHCKSVEKGSASAVFNSISHCKSVEKGDAKANITHTTCFFKTSKLVSPNASVVPGSFSSMDSFEQMLADENLDFNDPDLDKVLMLQTGIESTTDKQLNASKDYKDIIRVNKNTLEDSIEQIKSLCPEISDCSGYSGKADLEIDSDARAIIADDKNTVEQNERLSLDNAFSLDDSFLASHQLHSNSKTAEIESIPSATLRVPWKQRITSINDDEITDESGFKTNSNNKPDDEMLTISQFSQANKLKVFKANFETNFMGYDDEEGCSYLETSESKGKQVKKIFNKNASKLLCNASTFQYERSPTFQYERNTAFTDIQTDTQELSAKTGHNPDNTAQSKTASQFQSSIVCSESSQNCSKKSNKRFKPPALVGNKMLAVERRSFTSTSSLKCKQPTRNLQAAIFASSMSGELLFPTSADVQSCGTLVRQVTIPATFTSVADYKNILIAVVTEYLNHQLYDLAKRYHHSLSKVDVSELMGTGQGAVGKDLVAGDLHTKIPRCHCGAPAKIVEVKKPGRNNGRFFYACNGARNQQCKFFQWLDEGNKGHFVGGRRKISDPHSLITYMKSQRIQFYSPCNLVWKCRENIQHYFKSKQMRQREEAESAQKKQLYLKLSHKGASSLYSKDDIWLISQQLDFNPNCTFCAKSTYYGPSSSDEVEIEPIAGYSPSNWNKNVVCHALLAGNASSELSCLDNIRNHISQQSPLIIPSLLNRQAQGLYSSSGYQAPRVVVESNRSRNIFVHSEEIDELVRAYIENHHLNEDQAEAIKRVGSMFSVEKSDSVDSVLLIHGVFGAGKSYLLSVIVLFLVKVFQRNDLASPREPFPWKLLISSTTNVAVDRILQGLLDLGFEDFIRVGSVNRIAKPILPYSVHATGSDNQELKDFQQMLRSGELTAAEKQSVRQGIDKLRKGENKKKLAGVRVVGVTCASCHAPCISSMQFPLVLLDECSQMTEPSSLLPIAMFGCQKLLLVGDPKQLDPTIQGSDAATEGGLEQTLFDRLIKMGYLPTLLRTQYRCHPNISAVANKLFYGGMLMDGVSADQRSPVLPELPTICLYDVDRGQECCEGAGSYYNELEAKFVVFLILFLMSCDVEPTSVGVITLYKSQMARITDMLNSGITGENKEIKGVQVSTVDAFQGGEKDVIILSTVRTQATGFIDNDKRINVALTRARNHLLIVGNYGNLSRNLLWEQIIAHCRGFPNGIQSADEARNQLELTLERLKQEGSLHNKENNSSQTSEGSSKTSHKKKPVTKRKRKKDSSVETGPSPGISQPETVECKTRGNHGSGSSRTGKRKRNSSHAESPQFSLSHSSGDSVMIVSPCAVEEEENIEKQSSSSLKRSRHSDKLNPDLFDLDDGIATSDDEFTPFNS